MKNEHSQELLFRSSAIKLRLGRHEKSILTWSAPLAHSVRLFVPGVGEMSLSNNGSYSVFPTETTTYTIQAQFPDNSVEERHLTIEVLPESFAYTEVREVSDANGTHAELWWDLKNVEDVKLNGEKVPSRGNRSYIVTDTIRPTFVYMDKFGVRQKSLTIEPTSSLKFMLLRAFYGVLKLVVRPFTFIGRSPRYEYGITIILLFAILLFLIGQAVNDGGFLLFDKIDTYLRPGYRRCYSYVPIIIYVWLMAFARRRKDYGKSPWVVIWFSPLFAVYFAPEIIHCLYDDFDALATIMIYYGIYFGIFIIASLNVGRTKKSEFSFLYEFTPSLLLTSKKTLKSFVVR